jgi:CheY-like chemotaxis protein
VGRTTLRALLTARLDQLDEPERRILQRGAVEGELFHRGSVQAMAPEETKLTPRLTALSDATSFSPTGRASREDAYRFRQLLIRHAAYDALPKATRADLHRRFAAWLRQHGHSLVELDEILGYHLEQAARYLAELGRLNSPPRPGGTRVLGPLLRLSVNGVRIERSRHRVGFRAADIARSAASSWSLGGSVAVALARELRPAVVLMDIRMPQLDGIEATTRRSRPRIQQYGC